MGGEEGLEEGSAVEVLEGYYDGFDEEGREVLLVDVELF